MAYQCIKKIDGNTCNQFVFRCKHCGSAGCQNKNCSNQNFEYSTGLCLSCGKRGT